MSRRLAVAAALAPLCLAALVGPARSQTPSRERYAGTWVLVPELAEGRRTLRAAYDRVLRDANPLIRGIANQRLDIDQQLPRRITIELSGAYITTTLHCSRRLHWRTRERYPTTVAGDDGSEAELTQHFRDGHLELMSTFPEGQRWIVFALDGEDEMTMTTTIDPMMIDDNVHFQLRYRRAG